MACSSTHRCCSIACESCAWRYSLHVSRRILSHNPRRLFALTIQAGLHLPQFQHWRIAIRNLLDHRRRIDRWWRPVGLWCWLGRDGNVRGLVSLDSVTEQEFLAAFTRRWPTALSPVEVGAVREEVWRAMRPGVIAQSEVGQARYQRLKLALEPARTFWASTPQRADRLCEDPLPILL